MKKRKSLLLSGLLLGVLASGVDIKDRVFYVGVTGDYIRNHAWGGDNTHYTGAGAKFGYYFYLPNQLHLGNRVSLGASIFNKKTYLTNKTDKYPTKIGDYFIDVDWIWGVNNNLHPYIGVSYHYVDFDMKGFKELGWHGAGARVGALFYIGEHFEIELGGEYIYLGSKTDSDYPAETPTWKGSVALNYSF
ncbi:MAG: hypothetical protein C6I01_03745 [Epsilonproteobacteria bacterium]|nr:hypothetical protein [Campylobacterota bacterium]NPA89181.1 hypothetical protein [Campylobacterota bacterium]